MSVTLEQLMQGMTMDPAQKDDAQHIKNDIKQDTNEKMATAINSVDTTHKNIDQVDGGVTSLDKCQDDGGRSHIFHIHKRGRDSAPKHRQNFNFFLRISTSSATHLTNEEWRPRMAHCRGWAPFGSNDSSKITKAEVENIQSQILDRVPDDMKDRAEFFSTCIKNHSVSADILAAARKYAKMICDLVNLELTHRPMRVRNCEIKGAVETSLADDERYDPCSRPAAWSGA